MTKCNTLSGMFQGPKGKKFDVNFSGGHISSDGGLLLLSELDKKLGITAGISKILKSFDPRQRGKIKHSVQSMLRQRIYGIAAGHEDLNDHNKLNVDKLYQALVGSDKALAGASTLSRLENRSSRNLCVDIAKFFVEIFMASFDKPPEKLILDFDATDDAVHGMQEGRSFHGYYDHYCFLPLYVFCGHQLLVPYLRPANIDGAKHTWAILALLVKRFRQEWPGVRIVFRGDSGFCRHHMLTWCEKNSVDYIVGISKNKRLEKMTSNIAKKSKRKFNRTKRKAKLFCNVYYAAGTWSRKRRIICKSEYNTLGPNLRYVVTNIEGSAQKLYSELYCERGDMENRIKEQQLDLFADRTSCHKWWANQFRLLLSSVTYILVERLRALALKNTQFAKAQCGTIRLKLFKIGAVIRRNTRKVYVSLSSAFPYQNAFIQISNNICALK
jgi:hypothetical protein